MNDLVWVARLLRGYLPQVLRDGAAGGEVIGAEQAIAYGWRIAALLDAAREGRSVDDELVELFKELPPVHEWVVATLDDEDGLPPGGPPSPAGARGTFGMSIP